MSCYLWKERKTMWRNGYYAVAYELLEEVYDWELDPMCDCVPAQKFYHRQDKWRIRIYKAYIEDNLYLDSDNKWRSRCCVRTCHEEATSVENITKDEANKIWWNLENKKIPLNTIKEYFEDLTLTHEAERLMP